MKKVNRFKKAVGWTHLWLGLLSGIVVFIVAITGALYVFSQDIMDLAERDIRYVTPGSKRLDLNTVKAIGIRETLKYGGHRIPRKWDWIAVDIYQDRTHAIAYSSREYNKFNVLYTTVINPYSGKILQIKEGESKFWDVVVNLHTQLMLGEFGGHIVAWGNIIFLFMLISGIVLWWPKSKAARKQRFKLKLNASPKRLNYDLHNVLGFYASWIVIFCVITGMVWSFDWARNALFIAADGKLPDAKTTLLTQNVANLNNWGLENVRNEIEQAYPHYYMASINLAVDANKPIAARVWKEKGVSGFDDIMEFDPVTGKTLKLLPFEKRTLGDRINDITSDLHYGWIYGWPTKIMMFFACLIMASLPITGVLIWLGRNKKGNKTKKRHVAMAVQ